MNIEYAKLQNGILIPAPATITDNGRVHYHPTAALYRAHGYKVVTYTDKPTEDEKHYAESWVEEADTIRQVWTETEPPAPEEAVPTMEERITAVEAKQAQLESELSATMDAVDTIIMGEV